MSTVTPGAAPPDIASMLAGAGQQGAPAADPSMGGGTPLEQAVWKMYPSTDPAIAQQMAAGGPQAILAALPQILQQQEQDRQRFQASQDAATQALLAALQAPVGAPQGQAAPQNPAMGPDMGSTPSY